MKPHRPVERPWSVPVAAADIPETGRRVDLVADAAARAALAKAAGVAAIARLEAAFDLTRHGRDGVHVCGRVSATLEQTCVVTLEPLQTEVDEAVDLVFVPPGGQDPLAKGAEEHADAATLDPPEPLQNGTVDLGAVASEFLMLAVDPYPRKPGLTFAPPQAGEASAHPFAALAVLKKRSGENDR